jgi:hypothetical protein
MTVITEVWPSISPWNIWDLRYGDWLGYAATADQVIEARRKRT